MSEQIRPLPITGVALCNALGNDVRSVSAALRSGRSGLGANPVPVPFETAVGALDLALPSLPPGLSGWETRSAQIAAHLLSELAPVIDNLRARWRPERVAVLLGTSTAGADATEAAYKHYVDTGALPQEYDLWRHHTYGAILHVVRVLTGAAGPAWVVSTACTSSAKVLATAQRMIDAGVIDAAIVGGVDTLCAMTLCGFHSLGALSSTPCRPFSAERNGISIGEAGALLVVEREGEAIALLEGVGESSDAYHMSAPNPEGLGAEAAMRSALAQAGCAPSDVHYVNAHGTGTRLNDSAEAAALGRVLGDTVPVVSTKGYTGHTLGAAGGTEAALAVIAIAEGWIPAAVNLEPLDEAIALHVPTSPIDTPVRRVLSNSFAFGGNNISLLLGAP